ncbi:MAG: hypothetical protein FWG63_10365 [Defluviitaleaceae bacterium]|nr:hypothetical protein [Defluviitaleaceae bacterium]
MKKTVFSVIALLLVSVIGSYTSTVAAENELIFITEQNQAERNRMWQADITQLRDAIMQTHPIFTGHFTIFIPGDVLDEDSGRLGVWSEIPRNELLRQNTTRAFEELIGNVPNLSDVEIALGMQMAVASLQDNHFNMLPEEIFEAEAHLPLHFEHFGGSGGGFYLISTVEEFAHALNKRVLYINDTPIGHLMEGFARTVSTENIYDIRSGMATFLHTEFMLQSLGVRDNGVTVFVLEGADGERAEIVLTAEHEIRLADVEGARRRPVDETPFSPFMPAQNREDGSFPVFFEMQARNRFYFLEQYGILYIRIEGFSPTVAIVLSEIAQERDLDYDQIAELEGDFLEHLEQGTFDNALIMPPANVDIAYWMENDNWEVNPRIVELFESGSVNAAIVDVRNNDGGDPNHFFGLFRYLADNTDSDMLFHFANGSSRSASLVTTMFMYYLGALFVGEPPAQNTIFHGMVWGHDEFPTPDIVLEYSGMYISISNLPAHIESEEVGFAHTANAVERFVEMTPNFEFYAFRPHVLIEFTIEHWINNVDPLLEYVKERVSEGWSWFRRYGRF